MHGWELFLVMRPCSRPDLSLELMDAALHVFTCVVLEELVHLVERSYCSTIQQNAPDDVNGMVTGCSPARSSVVFEVSMRSMSKSFWHK